MNTEITFTIEYTSKPDPDFDGMSAPTLPRIGDHIRTPNGTTYKVDKVLFDMINEKMKCLIEVFLSPID